MYVEKFPNIYSDIEKPNLSDRVPQEVDLACVLLNINLLPDETRRLIVQQISKSALTGENLEFLESEHIQSLFFPNELKELKERIKNELLIQPISKMTDLWRSKYRKDNEDAEYHMISLKSNLTLLQEHFADLPELEKRIEEEIKNIDDWVTNNTIIDEIQNNTSMKSEVAEAPHFQERSIFEDIDL